MEARHGKHVIIDGEGISCPAKAFGFKQLPDGLKSGIGLIGPGIIKNENAGMKMFKDMKTVEERILNSFYYFRWKLPIIQSDNVVMEDEVEKECQIKKVEKIIEVVNLTKKFGEFTAVNNISFYVNRGELFGLLGPNGAGKTTTINMLVGLAKITDGKIFYKGEDLTQNIKKAQKFIGVVPDESNLYEEMTGYENLCFCGSLYGLSKKVRKSKSIELLELFGLSDVANKKFKEYSKGMKRKLTIAAALIHEPEILFMDEPTTGIDVASARQIRNLIKDLHRKGTTIFLTTHYIEEAERLCDRVAFINKGEIIKIDTVPNLIEQTRESYIVEISFEESPIEKIRQLLDKLNQQFNDIKCFIKNQTTIKVISNNKINISPVINFVSKEGFFIIEAKLIKPTLEDAFVKFTGIEIDMMKKEKEKK
jgi:ABC-2 type transport system ATP-binding protein